MPATPPYTTSFEYNASGIRTKKTYYNPISNNTTVTEYMLDGATVLGEKITCGDDVKHIYYIYNSGELVGMECDGVPYYYRKNALGDIVEIYNASNTLVGSYKYDAWGNCTIGTNVGGIATYNPFRYRGYYYDSETGYYYLQTRYYDPEIGRFLNADSIEYLNFKKVNGCNLYAYCLNNPIMYYDPTGHRQRSVLLWVLVGVLALTAIAFVFSGVGALAAIGAGVLSGGTIGMLKGFSDTEYTGDGIAVSMLKGMILGGTFAVIPFLVPMGLKGLAITAGITFVAGSVNYGVQCYGDRDSFELNEMLAYGFSTMVQGMIAFGFGKMFIEYKLYYEKLIPNLIQSTFGGFIDYVVEYLIEGNVDMINLLADWLKGIFVPW